MYKKYIFKCLACSFVFCYVIWTAILVVVRPALLQEGGLKESYGELSFFLFSFSFR